MIEFKSNLNKNKAYTTVEEKNQNLKEYYIKNKEKLDEKKNTKNICDCGGNYTRSNKAIHFKSKKHKQHEQQIINNNITNNYNITNLTINQK